MSEFGLLSLVPPLLAVALAIVTPIVIPVAWSLTGDHTMVAAVVGTVFSGAIFGDHTSSISDTTVLSATFTGADLIDHVRTQLYYAVTVALVAITLLLVWGSLGSRRSSSCRSGWRRSSSSSTASPNSTRGARDSSPLR